jgi:hypothetical protein
MKYDLAKELNDAGYRQGGKGSWTYPSDNLITRSRDRVYVPTLTELIEACGERFGSLGRDWLDDTGRFWRAIDRGREETVPPRIEQTGDTPEEAVARLWLALQKK